MTPLAAWETRPYERVFRDLTGGSPRVEQSEYLESGLLPVVDQGQQQIAGYVDDLSLVCRAPLPCLVFGDHTRIVKYVDHPFAIGAQGVRVLVPVPEVDSRFGFYLLQRVRFPQDTGYTRHTRFLKRTHFAFPALAEQRRIAVVLDKADAVRRKRRESLRLLDDFLRSAFLEMFGDPVRNEKGWEIRKLADNVVETQYGTSKKANSDRRGIPVVRMSNLTSNGETDLSDIKWCEIPATDLPKYTIRRGDILFNRTNSPELVGKTAVWERHEAYAFAGYLVRVRVREDRLLPRFLSGFLNSHYGKRLLFETSKPSINMSNISASTLMRLRIPVPPLENQRGYAELDGRVQSTKERWKMALREADQLFNSLAQRAFANDQTRVGITP